MTLWLGKLEVQLLQLGRGHTKGDTVVWLPQDRVLLSGDLVEFDATPYAGDAYFKDWPQTLDNVAALKPVALVPGRGAALTATEQVAAGLRGTRDFIADVRASVAGRRRRRQGPERRLQGHLRQAQAQVRPLGHLRPLHAVRRDALLRRGDAVRRPAHLDRRARHRRCGRRWKAERAESGSPASASSRLASRLRTRETRHARKTLARAQRDAIDYQRLRFDYQRSADQDAPPSAGAPSGGGGRRRPGRPGAGDRPGAARRAGGAARQRRHALDRLARHLLRQAHAGDLRPARLRRPHGRQGRVVERRQGVLQGPARSTASTCCPRPATSGRPSSTCSSTTSRASSPSAPPRCRLIDLRWKNRVTGVEQHADHAVAHDRDARRRLPARRRLRGRLRRLALGAAPG